MEATALSQLRGVAFTLDGLRTDVAHPIPDAPLTPQQVNEVMSGPDTP